ncbi:MAG: DUF1145 domain-containing protein [Pseudomonadales bacterium]|nr:DUF1145 domain-containing protein [Pseudomonadales bacterium]
MQKFFTIGKWLTLGFWLLPLLALFGVFAPPWDFRLVALGFVILIAHLLELVFVYGGLRTAGRAEVIDLVLVMLVGLFHWVPILRRL